METISRNGSRQHLAERCNGENATQKAENPFLCGMCCSKAPAVSVWNCDGEILPFTDIFCRWGRMLCLCRMLAQTPKGQSALTLMQEMDLPVLTCFCFLPCFRQGSWPVGASLCPGHRGRISHIQLWGNWRLWKTMQPTQIVSTVLNDNWWVTVTHTAEVPWISCQEFFSAINQRLFIHVCLLNIVSLLRLNQFTIQYLVSNFYLWKLAMSHGKKYFCTINFKKDLSHCSQIVIHQYIATATKGKTQQFLSCQVENSDDDAAERTNKSAHLHWC